MDGVGDLFIVDHAGTVGDCPELGAVSRAIELQRTQVNFGNVNTPSSTTLTLHYDVAETTKFGPIDFVPTGDFALGSGNTCTGTVSEPGSCVVNIVFSPAAQGLRQGQLQLADNSGQTLVTTSLQGEGMAPTTTTLTSSVDPSAFREPVTFTTVVTSGDGPIPDGETVRFMDGATTLAEGTLAQGSTTFTISTLKVGTTLVRAAYGGDTNFAASTSTAVKQEVKGPAH
jgi:Bacterial Ig-like domain (group 3)